MTSFYSEQELRELGLKSYGKDVKLSRYTRIYSPEMISIGNNVRIDDFCILSGKISIGSNVHISAFVALYGNMGITLEDYTGISPRTSIFSAMDDFSGDFLIGPIHDEEQTNVTGGEVILKRFSQIGAHCIVFPNITIGEGTIVGACSMVNKSLVSWSMCWGTPAIKHKQRKRNLLKLKDY